MKGFFESTKKSLAGDYSPFLSFVELFSSSVHRQMTGLLGGPIYPFVLVGPDQLPAA
jgi:hypothetical protein